MPNDNDPWNTLLLDGDSEHLYKEGPVLESVLHELRTAKIVKAELLIKHSMLKMKVFLDSGHSAVVKLAR